MRSAGEEMRLIIAVHFRVQAHQAGEQGGSRAGMPVDEKLLCREEGFGFSNFFGGDGGNFAAQWSLSLALD